MPHLPSVEFLQLTRCNELLLMSIMAYTAITVLWIGGFPEMISFPEGLLKNLTLIKDLYIHHCPKLKSLSKDVHDLPAIEKLVLLNCGEVESLMEGVRNLTSLKYYHVKECNHLTSLPDEGFQGLTSLQDLFIQHCGNLRSLGEGLQVRHLNSLVFLFVRDCPELAALPESLFNLTALKTLRLYELPKLASLSEEIGNLASLEELEIMDCPHVLSLPASLQKVTTLQSLIIDSCPTLERRCAKEEGEDWYKIAHVPVIVINGQCLQEVQTRSIWLPPDDNFVKLNFDGSYNPFTHDAGIRGIIRSSAGTLISANSWKLVTDKALAAEIQALLKGVGVYIVDGLQNIIIEGDCLTLIDSLRRFGTLTWDVMVIWRKLILALTRIPRWEVRFCKGRET
ncbi:hypothetical protein MRB53_005184 [Persea americana]|uniref:Uncharacterized protein n=1 Tax=Persea americana TaxID=3435 RepID=A0ACC2MCA3_PERAE|nr:hypothetical protein MRB53_005184 [Persea americana]